VKGLGSKAPSEVDHLSFLNNDTAEFMDITGDIILEHRGQVLLFDVIDGEESS